MRTRDEDPGIATLDPTASAAPAPARPRPPILWGPDGGIPWCQACEVHGHAEARCPKANGASSMVTDVAALERLLVGHGWDEAR